MKIGDKVEIINYDPDTWTPEMCAYFGKIGVIEDIEDNKPEYKIRFEDGEYSHHCATELKLLTVAKTDIKTIQMPDFQRDIMQKAVSSIQQARDELIKQAISYALGHSDWNIKDIILRCSVKHSLDKEVFKFDEIELIEFYQTKHYSESSPENFTHRVTISFKYKKLY